MLWIICSCGLSVPPGVRNALKLAGETGRNWKRYWIVTPGIWKWTMLFLSRGERHFPVI